MGNGIGSGYYEIIESGKFVTPWVESDRGNCSTRMVYATEPTWLGRNLGSLEDLVESTEVSIIINDEDDTYRILFIWDGSELVLKEKYAGDKKANHVVTCYDQSIMDMLLYKTDHGASVTGDGLEFVKKVCDL